MHLFEVPQTTRYDLNFALFGIPVRVHPLFWVMAILFGASLGNILYILLWILVVFGSVLLHEFGHALMMRVYGQPALVVLYAGGGLAVPESIGWGRQWATVGLATHEKVLISLAGPGAGFLLAALMMLVITVLGGSVSVSWLLGVIPLVNAWLPLGGPILNIVIAMLFSVNIFWGVINLMPVYPLDGGQIARHIFVHVDPWGGLRRSLWVSVGAGAIVALVGLLVLQSAYMALMFGLLAFQSYQALSGRF